MKFLVLIFSVIISVNLCAQSSNGFYSTEIMYGNILQEKNFNNQLNTLQNYHVFKPLQTIGISSDFHVKFSRVKNADRNVTYSQIIPQDIDLTNGIHGKINGFILGYHLFGKNLLPKANRFNLLVRIGINAGRIRISGDNFTSQKNPFFCPTISIQPRIRIKKTVISFRAEYGVDVSSKLWRSLHFTKQKGDISLPNFSQSGLNLYLTFGRVQK